MKKLLLSASLLSLTAIACTVGIQIMTPVVESKALQSPKDHWIAIGDKLESIYGGTGVDSEVSATIPLKLCIAKVCGSPTGIHMFKPCGKTFKQAAYDISAQASGLSGAGGLTDVPPMGPGANVGSIDLGGCISTTVPKQACTRVDGGTPHCVTMQMPALTCPGIG